MSNVIYVRCSPAELIHLNTLAAADMRSRNSYVAFRLAEAVDKGYAPSRDIKTIPATEAVALFLRLSEGLKRDVVKQANECGLSASRYVRGVLFQ